MKRLSNLLAALVFASLVIFMSCGGGGSDPAPDPLIEKANNLTVTWVPTTVRDPDGDVYKRQGFSSSISSSAHKILNCCMNSVLHWIAK